MVMTLRKRVPSIQQTMESEPETETPLKKSKTQKNPKPKKRTPNYSTSESEFDDSDSEKENDIDGYEKIREQRIRENRERMEKLGIFALSTEVFNRKKKKAAPPQKRKKYPPLYPRVRDRSYDFNRRSSRLQEIETEKTLKLMGICIPDDWKSEIYTEEDEKLLGDCETKWTLKSDGVDEEGDRLYNTDGIPCHQCRQRVYGKFTYCGKCRSPQGQLCGDCLYTRYGENVLEVVEIPTWSCPACRGICNCSRCRRAKGWDPINIPHSKVVESGFKSVAHYLILTRRAGGPPKELNGGTVTDLTAEEKTEVPQHNAGSDYSTEWSGSESDDSDSEDESKGEKIKESPVDSQVGTDGVYTKEVAAAEAEGSNEGAVTVDGGSNEGAGAANNDQVL